MSLSAVSQLNYEKKNNAWNIRCLDTGSIVQTKQQPIVLYCKLTGFRSQKELLMPSNLPKSQ